MNKDILKEHLIKAEQGDVHSIEVVKRVLEPRKEDSVSDIEEKLKIFIRIIFLKSLKFKDASHHFEIRRFYAEQIHSYLNYGKPKYKGGIFYGYRESAKTSVVKFCEVYLSIYLYEIQNSTNIVSEDGVTANQFNMDLFNILAFSKIRKYYGLQFPEKQTKKKESQTMSKFTTLNNVTYSSKGARKTSRGNVKVDIDENTGEVDNKRPSKVIFDDIENEVTLLSVATTNHIDSVISATIDGLDQVTGFFIILGNYLSLRGNIAKYLSKYRDDPNIFILDIPIQDKTGQITWEDKYCLTDLEAENLLKQGIVKVSIESIRRQSDNFETEFLNNPKRNSVYFSEDCIESLLDEDLVPETERNLTGYLEIEEPKQNATYIISSDASKGVGRDESAFVVLKTTGLFYEEVANFKSKNISPEDFAPFLATIGRAYNNALIIPENNYPNNEVIAFLRPIYNNIYKQEVKKDVFEYGVNTNLKSKPEMFLNLKKILKNKLLKVRSRALYNQILEYPNTEVLSLIRDGGGGHWDLIMSLAIGLYKASEISADIKKDTDISDVLNRKMRNIYSEDTSHSW